jgi:hypothetical protein
MPGFILTIGTAMTCFHGIKVTTPPMSRVQVSGQPVLVATNVLTVSPVCPFQIPTPVGPKPQPCVRVQWSMMSARVKVNGQPVLVQPPPPIGPGAGSCLSVEQIPQGAPWIAATQVRVTAS